MSNTVRWGIMGAGNIARKFAGAVPDAADAELVAVGSRSADKAEAFGEEFDIPHRHGSYDDLLADGEVEAVYVATPHPMHKDNAVACLRAGKAVLCEKPLTVNATEAREVAAVARETGVFCMEAMWSRFLPTIVKVRELVAAGAIGEPRMLMADFGFRTGWNPQGRALNPELAGGGLLDVGVYPIALASMLFGAARRVGGLADIGETGVDEQAGIVLGYEGGRLAVLACGVRTRTPQTADVLGTEGSIHVASSWWNNGAVTILADGKDPETLDVPMTGNGFNYEIDEVVRCLAAGQTESDVMPLDESIEIMRTLDDLRAQWGLKYPFE